MSSMEYHYGKLRPVDKSENETFEEFAKRVCDDRGISLKDIKKWTYSSFMEFILTELGFVYNGSNNTLYEIYDHSIMDDEDFIFREIGPKNYEFIGAFYNGGTCLSEVLEDCIVNHLKDKNE